jgi:hypothetical protein
LRGKRGKGRLAPAEEDGYLRGRGVDEQVEAGWGGWCGLVSGGGCSEGDAHSGQLVSRDQHDLGLEHVAGRRARRLQGDDLAVVAAELTRLQ